jgi:hypothetical protein
MRFLSFGLVTMIGCLVSGCGSVVVGAAAGSGSGSGSGGAGGASSGSAGSGAAPACSFASALQTAPGPCADEAEECGGVCGTCAAPEVCSQSDNRCYALQGPPDQFFSPLVDGLLRGLYTSPEGMTCTVGTTGVLTQVEAGLWNAGIEAIVMEVLLPCDGKNEVAATVKLPASAFPTYNPDTGWYGSIKRTTFFVLDPPIRVEQGQSISVLFHAEGAEHYDKAAVEDVIMSDVDPSCAFVSIDMLGLPKPVTWDYVARMYIHPQ